MTGVMFEVWCPVCDDETGEVRFAVLETGHGEVRCDVCGAVSLLDLTLNVMGWSWAALREATKVSALKLADDNSQAARHVADPGQTAYAALFEVPGRSVARWNRSGMVSDVQADRLAVRVGLVPDQVWSGYSSSDGPRRKRPAGADGETSTRRRGCSS